VNNFRKRVEHLEAREPAYDPVHASLIWAAMATLPMSETERRVLLDHADAVAAGHAHGEPCEPIGFLQAIAVPEDWAEWGLS
jgi:hypothetical protein